VKRRLGKVNHDKPLAKGFEADFFNSSASWLDSPADAEW